MMIVTTESIHEERYQVLGLVRGCSAYSKNAVKDIGQAFKSIVGGELKSYSDLMEMASATATEKMEAQAEALGADAIIGVSYATMSMADGAPAVIASGTAVKLA